jgi:cellulose synthase/poly-beta-1,6-N-acetylglucosamine synthase-like glycosyltransferase
MQFIFWSAIALLVYTFLGYPLLLFFWRKYQCICPKNMHSKKHIKNFIPSFNSKNLPHVSIILIVRNSETIIDKKIGSLLSLRYPKNKLDIIIISDHSNDQTVKKIQQWNHPYIQCIENTKKSSKSACLNQAIQSSTATILMLTDVRQTHQNDSLYYLVHHFNDPKVAAVSGELILNDPKNPFSKSMDAYWKYEKWIRMAESDIHSSIGVTGAIYAIRRINYQTIPNDTLLDDVLIPMNCVFQSMQVKFEPKSIAYDIASDDILREKNRKIRTIAGNWQLFALKPDLFNPFKNPVYIQFISHKVLRVLAPFFMLIIFVFNAFLAYDSFIYLIIFTCQISLYLFVWFERFPFYKRPIKLLQQLHAFLNLMWFTWLGFFYFVSKKHLSLWK